MFYFFIIHAHVVLQNITIFISKQKKTYRMKNFVITGSTAEEFQELSERVEDAKDILFFLNIIFL